QVVVTGPECAKLSGMEDLGGKQIYANPLTVYYENLEKANERLKARGKTPIDIKAADNRLNQDDLIQMVNAGLIPATVTTKERAELWSQVLPNLRPHPEMAVASGTQLAWAVRKENRRLKAMLDDFIKTHGAGTSFGNTLIRRYLQNTKWITNSTSAQE